MPSFVIQLQTLGTDSDDSFSFLFFHQGAPIPASTRWYTVSFRGGGSVDLTNSRERYLITRLDYLANVRDPTTKNCLLNMLIFFGLVKWKAHLAIARLRLSSRVLGLRLTEHGLRCLLNWCEWLWPVVIRWPIIRVVWLPERLISLRRGKWLTILKQWALK